MAEFGLDNSISPSAGDVCHSPIFLVEESSAITFIFSVSHCSNVYRLTVQKESSSSLWNQGTCQLSVPLEIATALEPRIKKMFVIACSITAPNILLMFVEHSRVAITPVALF
jgi:hypothetical protein